MSKQERQPDEGLTPELSLLLDAIRREFDAKLSAQWWRYLAIGGVGGTLGGLIGRVAFPQQTAQAIAAVAGLFT